MNENTTMVLRGALTHLRVQRQEIETAIAAILAVLGEGDLVPARQVANARPAPPETGAKVTRKVTPATGKGAAAATKTIGGAGLTPAEAIVGYLEHHGPSQPKAIRAALKLTERECKVALRKLAADKQIASEGATAQRRYRLVTTRAVKAVRTSPPPPLVATDDEYETVWNGASPQPLSAANGGLS